MIKRKELDELAQAAGLEIHHECGGFRIQAGGRNVFPDGLVCPVTTKRECWIFLMGVAFKARALKRVVRRRRLTPGEAAKYQTIREQVAEELPELISRHHDRMRRKS